MRDLFNTSGAEFSPCGKYRYMLWRKWDESLPMVAFIGLNPSTANATQDDPTIRRVKSFARQWGFGGVYMLNLFGIISPDPTVLVTSEDPIGDNDNFLNLAAGLSDVVAFAWGSFKQAKARGETVIGMFPNAICLRKTKDGCPSHPLYIPSNVQPVYFQTDKIWDFRKEAFNV